MQLVLKGKNVDLSDRLKSFVETKVAARLERLLPDVAEIEVELSASKTRSAVDRYVAQVTLKTNGTTIRGEQTAGDTYAAVDAVLDKIDRQVARFKTRRSGVYAKVPAEAKHVLPADVDSADDEEDEGHLVRTKRFPMKPMPVEEALMQMQMLGHDFFLFLNSETDSAAVVYRRKDGNYGLIEPELI